MDLGPDGDPRAVIADKGYDAKANRDAARRRGIVPVIPYRSNTKNPLAMRCEKTARNYASFVALACVFILVKSVHTA